MLAIRDMQTQTVLALLARFSANPELAKNASEVKTLLKLLESEFYADVGGEWKSRNVKMVRELVTRLQENQGYVRRQKKVQRLLRMLEAGFGGGKVKSGGSKESARPMGGGLACTDHEA